MRQRLIYEVSLKGSHRSHCCSEICRSLFENYGVPSESIAELNAGQRFRISTYFYSKKKVERLRRLVKRNRIKKIIFESRTLKPRDWQDKWKEKFRKFSLSPSIDIIPQWQQAGYRTKKKIPIFLQPGNSFGTGLHSSTQLIAELIEEKSIHIESFLDIGTGTGILTIIALKLGAREAWAIDFDPSCVECARKNFEINQCSGVTLRELDLVQLKSRKKFDFVAANLISETLIKNSAKLVSLVRKKGYLAISGIIEENLPDVRKALQESSLEKVKIKRDLNWCACLFKKS